jgi:hypothetical protein
MSAIQKKFRRRLDGLLMAGRAVRTPRVRTLQLPVSTYGRLATADAGRRLDAQLRAPFVATGGVHAPANLFRQCSSPE